MSLNSLILLAIALSMDSFAVSVALGFNCCNAKLKHILKVVLFLSTAQAVFPLLGWLIADFFSHSIKKYDHWIAFTFLAIIGIQMIYEGIKDQCKNNNMLPSIKTLLILSVATSIDAFITGLSFAFLDVNICIAMVTIFLVTTFFTFFGFTYSRKIGKKCSKYSEIIGGSILIIIGLKILLEHLFIL